jgi:hypothetical protein
MKYIREWIAEYKAMRAVLDACVERGYTTEDMVTFARIIKEGE